MRHNITSGQIEPKPGTVAIGVPPSALCIDGSIGGRLMRRVKDDNFLLCRSLNNYGMPSAGQTSTPRLPMLKAGCDLVGHSPDSVTFTVRDVNCNPKRHPESFQATHCALLTLRVMDGFNFALSSEGELSRLEVLAVQLTA